MCSQVLQARESKKSQSEMCLGKVQGVISYPDSSGCIIKGKIYKTCVQSALIYGTETWTMKKANLHSLGSGEKDDGEMDVQMMVRWMGRVSLKDRKRSVDLYSLLGVQSMAEVVRRGRLRVFGHVERR